MRAQHLVNLAAGSTLRNLSTSVPDPLARRSAGAFATNASSFLVGRGGRGARASPRIAYSTMIEGIDRSFGPWTIGASEIFAETPKSFAFVNLKPVVPGHVLVSPKRVTPRFADLDGDEVADMWKLAQVSARIRSPSHARRSTSSSTYPHLTRPHACAISGAQAVGSKVEGHHGASSITFAIQDGAEAGQTVPHVHVHVMPRKAGDFEKNDEIYDELDKKSEEMSKALDQEERKPRTRDEMATEAMAYRKLFV